MGTAVQVAVAAGLALAWIWVLGRPLLGGFRPSEAEWAAGGATEDPDGGGDPDFWEIESVGRFGWHGWRQRSPVARRRQALLATIFATFASFLLAVALRGRFVWLFGLMVVTLAVHLAIASYLGGRMLHAREEARRARRVQQPPVPTSSVLASAIGPDHDRVDRSYKSPISAGGHAVSSFVDALIQMEWGSSADEAPSATPPARASAPAPEPPIEVDVLPDPPIEVDVLPPVADQPEAVPAAPDLEPEPDPEPEVAAAAEAEVAPKPAPFTRPAAQSAPRKPKARPIYIHSQLDEEGFEPPKAVNHP